MHICARKESHPHRVAAGAGDKNTVGQEAVDHALPASAA